MRFLLHNIHAACIAAATLLALSCAQPPHKGKSYNAQIVINELMAGNRTGLLTEAGKSADWIEIKNLSAEPVSLSGYSLVSEYAEDNADTTAATQSMQWELPDTTVEAGKCILIFASKSDKHKGGKELRARLKLGKDKGCVRLLAPDNEIKSEVGYDHLNPDQAYRRKADGGYEKTYMPSPGFENTAEGYEAYCNLIDGQRRGPLLIWEVMSRSDKTSANWVELKNVADTAINLGGYCLDNKMGKGKGWPLPDKRLEPGQVFAVQTVGKKARTQNQSQAAFKLGDAETVVLSKDGKFVDGVCAKITYLGTSIGRVNGRKGFFFFASPSRGEENKAAPCRFMADMPKPDITPGIHNNTKKLCLHLNSDGRTIHYTLDGSEPTQASPVYKDSLVITKSTVVRAYAEGDSNTLRSNIATATYLLNEQHTLPVLCIAVKNSDLYDHYNGIYANGPGYTQTWPHLGANYFKSHWKKKAHVEFFDGKEGFSTDCGLKIFGGFSRCEAKKSFCLKFNNQYGSKELEYDFLGKGESLALRSLVLRSGSQDYNRCMVRDEFFTSLMAPQCPELLIQDYRPVAVYINAEYFGLYYFREKIDKHFVSRMLNVSNDSITILMSMGYQEEGNNREYNKLMAYIMSHDMGQKEHYDYVRECVDLQGLIDYKLGEIYSCNSDVGNIRYVRSTDPGSDKKWHFVFYDLDATWVGDKPDAAFYLNINQPNVGVHNRMIGRLLANKDFRKLFMERLSLHMHKTFSTANATAVFNGLVNTIRPEMKRNCKRWPQLSYETWEKNVAEFREKFASRPKTMLNDLRKVLSITAEEEKMYFSDLGF